MPVLRPEFPDHSSPFSRDQERERKRAAIISAASRRFNERGFAQTRLEDVAGDLGLTKTSISYYFTCKEDLAEAVYRASADFLNDAVDHAMSATGDATDSIRMLLSAYSAQLMEAARGKRPHLAALRDLDALPAPVAEQIAGEVSQCLTRINTLVSDWIEQSGAPLGRPEPASFLVLALLDWMGERQEPRRQDSEIAMERDQLLDLITHGLTTKPFPALTAAADLTYDEASEIFDRDARNRMKKEAFLKAGSRFFNQRGFGGTSLAEVAASLGVSRGAFYYHIEDKEQFLDQCVERSLHLVERTLQAAEEAELDGLDQIYAVMTDLIYRQAAGVEPLLRPSMAAVLPKPRQRRHLTRLRNVERQMGDALTDAAAEGMARDLDAGLIENILASVIFLNGGYTLAAAKSFSSWSLSEDPRTATADYLHLLFYGLNSDK
jgi:AcrR family transcriptional regulator